MKKIVYACTLLVGFAANAQENQEKEKKTEVYYNVEYFQKRNFDVNEIEHTGSGLILACDTGKTHFGFGMSMLVTFGTVEIKNAQAAAGLAYYGKKYFQAGLFGGVYAESLKDTAEKSPEKHNGTILWLISPWVRFSTEKFKIFTAFDATREKLLVRGEALYVVWANEKAHFEFESGLRCDDNCIGPVVQIGYRFVHVFLAHVTSVETKEQSALFGLSFKN